MLGLGFSPIELRLFYCSRNDRVVCLLNYSTPWAGPLLSLPVWGQDLALSGFMFSY